MDNEELSKRIHAFPRWHYQFDLQGILTPIFDAKHQNRHLQRKAYFFDPLVRLCGGSLKRKRVLDLGCNAGFWSLQAVEAGCDYVLGIDGRQMHVDQANLVFETKNIEPSRYEFRRQDIFDLDRSALGRFDVVFCFGLLYHLSKHIDLLELISSVNTDLLMIDTLITDRPDPVLEIRHESLDEPRNAIDYDLIMVPSRTAILEMTGIFGYKSVVLRPTFSDYGGSWDFQAGVRRAFFCAKETPLVGLDVEQNGYRGSRASSSEFDATKLRSAELLKILSARIQNKISRTLRKLGR